MKRCIMVCTGMVFMGMVIMFGSAGVSSAQQQPVAPLPHHEILEWQQPGVLQSAPPPTGIGKQFEGPGTTYFVAPPATLAPAPTPAQPVTPGAPPAVAPLPHHEILEWQQPGVLQSAPPPTGIGKQFEGPGTTYFVAPGGVTMAPAPTPAQPVTPGAPPAVAPLPHHEILEWQQPGVLQSAPPPTGAGKQFEGPGTTYFVAPPATLAPAPTPAQPPK